MSDEIPMELSLQMGRYVCFFTLFSILWVWSTHLMKTPIARAGRDSRIFRESWLHAQYSKIIFGRCNPRRYRQTWLPSIYQTHSAGRSACNRTLEVSCIVFQQILAYQISSFPYLVSINSVLPAIIAGNAVLLKPSPQTPLTAERFAVALHRAGVPPHVIQVVHMSPELTNHAINNPSVAFVSFTGSVPGGRSVAKVAATGDGFTGVALEVRSLISTSYSLFDLFWSLVGKIQHMLDLMLIWTTRSPSWLMVGHLSNSPCLVEYKPALKVPFSTPVRVVARSR